MDFNYHAPSRNVTGAPARVARPARAPQSARESIIMPTLFRFLAVLGVIAGLAFAAMFALATFVEPEPREMTQTIPPSKLQSR
jgi:hypothetical protein